MEVAVPHARRRSALLFVTAVAHAAGSALYGWIQPRGFSPFSPAFFEHELLGPIVLAISIAAAYSIARRRAALARAALGAIAGSWLVVAGFGLFTGTTRFALLLALPFTGAIVLLAAARFMLPAQGSGLLAGTALGAALGAGFWASALAPAASTRPAGEMLAAASIPEAPPILERDGLRVRVDGRRVVVEHGEARAEILPGFDYDAVADGGGLSVLDYRVARLPPWRAGLGDDGRIVLAAESTDFEARADIVIDGPAVRIRATTTVKRAIAAHLGAAVAARISGPARVLGHAWPSGWVVPSHFVAFRGDRLGFFRAARDEKGPFDRIAELPPEDPVIEAGGFRIRVIGWAAQASRAASPTAGWSVSQGAIERSGDWLLWEIAATSIGRGWHTVRTAAGVYAFEVVLER